jgi:hypothetical protein
MLDVRIARYLVSEVRDSSFTYLDEKVHNPVPSSLLLVSNHSLPDSPLLTAFADLKPDA